MKLNLIYRLLIIASLLGPVTGLAEEFDSILSCLGQEELDLHKKKQLGPVYTLNQALINELSAISNMNLLPKYLNQICKAQRLPVSVRLIEVLLVYEKKAFSTKKLANETEHFYEMRINNYETLIQKTPRILYRYLASLQAQTPYPFCLEEKIKGLKEFTERIQYLEDDISVEDLIKNKKRLRSIFQGLRNYRQILQECSLLQMELDKNKGRKTNP